MLVVVKLTHPDVVFADHSDSQLDEVFELYPAEDFKVWRTREKAYAPGPVPSDYEVVERPEVVDG